MDSNTVAVFVGMFGMAYFIMNWVTKKRSGHKCPPCLPTVPVLGSIPFIPSLDKMQIHFMSLSNELGNVIACYFGRKYVVILNDFDAMHDAFSKRSVDFASRTRMYVNHDIFNPNVKGIIDRPYDAGFKKHHQLSLSILKSFGFGQTIMEERINIEIEELVAQFRLENGAPTFPRDILTTYVLNVIASITFGSRYAPDDPTLQKLISAVHHFVADSMSIVPVNMIPLLRFIPYFDKSIQNIQGHQAVMLNVIEEKLKIATNSGCGTSFITSFIEAAGEDYDKEELMYTVRDLLIAGTETSATTLQWALVMMANYPDIQKRIQVDIDSLVSRDRMPSLADKAKLPYIEATISEIMRYKTIIPLGVPHETLCDTEVLGLYVPKGTFVLSNIYGCHMDAKSWTNPELFFPERFLDKDNNLINKDRVVSFSMGKRSCFGELLARQEIYLFFTGLLQNFNIVPNEGQSKVEFRESHSVTVSPADYTVRLVPRPRV